MTESEDQYIKKLEKEIKILKEQLESLQIMFQMTVDYQKKIQNDLKIKEQKILEFNENLISSLNYAKYIQDAFVVQLATLQTMFKNSFIFQKPKSIVSGDFVWAYNKTNKIYLAVGDCTGHGVPGAMLSIFIINLLNQIVGTSDNLTPAEILYELDKLMQKFLFQSTEKIKDSVDIAIIRYNTVNHQTYFSGSKNSLIHVRNGMMTVYKGAKHILGNPEIRNENFENAEVSIQKNDMLYMFTDGFADQFGGENYAKFSSKRLLALLQTISELNINDQFEYVESTFNNWKGDHNQTDDVLLMGIKI
ncbi:MAG: PP2C family protein-serine/threonine phosphatase [Bacteroidales bacterium]